MPAGTGLDIVEKELPDQFIDVGIAEEHAVLCAAGMATGQMRLWQMDNSGIDNDSFRQQLSGP